jgi:hypothetical protein
MTYGRDVRLAHAFRSVPTAVDTDDIGEVIRILVGGSRLTPRPPADTAAVSDAESRLGLGGSAVYTYAGCLHPCLGTIGLIISPSCLNRCLQGVTRCDTGGLVGRRGSFAHLPESEVDAALRSLTCDNADWHLAFSKELAGSYTSVRSYVSGALPRHEDWGDARSRCIAAHLATTSAIPDRRLWTWEVRLASSPEHTEYEAITLSPEASKRLEFLRLGGTVIPGSVRIVRGRVGSAGVHHFHEEATIDALCGRRAR